MTSSDTRKKVVEIVALVLERPVGLDEAVTRDNEPLWDSLRHIDILFAIESEFGVRFDERTAAEIQDVPQLVEAIKSARAE